MKNILTVLLICFSGSTFAQPGLIKYSVNPYNFKINKDTTKSLSLTQPLFFSDDSTASLNRTFLDSLRGHYFDTSTTIRNGYVISYDSTNRKWVMVAQSSGGGGGTPGGADTYVQYDSSGSFSGNNGLTYNRTAKYLTIGGYLITDTIYGGNASGGNIIIYSTAHATKGLISLANILTVDEVNSKVGIGLTNPATPLDILGTSNLLKLRNTSSTGYNSLRLYNDVGTDARAFEIGLTGSAFATPIITSAPTGEAGFIVMNGDKPLVIGNNATSRLEISAGGNVKINTKLGIGTAPSYIIHTVESVNGVSRVFGQNTSSGTAAQTIFEVANNSSNSVQIGMTSSGFTTSGLLTAGMGYVQCNTGALLLRTLGANDMIFGVNTTLEAMRVKSTGLVGLGVSSPSGILHIKAGTATASTAPLKFTSGTLLTTAEAGAVEFLTDKYYGTITTGAARKEFTLNDAALTSGKVPVATTNGRLTDGLTISSGTYTPTLTNVTNVTASTAYECQYLRVGNTVTVSGKVDIDVTLGAASELGMTLPIASAMTAEENLGGTASSSAAASLVSAVKADATNDRASFNFVAISLTNDSYFFEFTYQIK